MQGQCKTTGVGLKIKSAFKIHKYIFIAEEEHFTGSIPAWLKISRMELNTK